MCINSPRSLPLELYRNVITYADRPTLIALLTTSKLLSYEAHRALHRVLNWDEIDQPRSLLEHFTSSASISSLVREVTITIWSKELIHILLNAVGEMKRIKLLGVYVCLSFAPPRDASGSPALADVLEAMSPSARLESLHTNLTLPLSLSETQRLAQILITPLCEGISDLSLKPNTSRTVLNSDSDSDSETPRTFASSSKVLPKLNTLSLSHPFLDTDRAMLSALLSGRSITRLRIAVEDVWQVRSATIQTLVVVSYCNHGPRYTLPIDLHERFPSLTFLEAIECDADSMTHATTHLTKLIKLKTRQVSPLFPPVFKMDEGFFGTLFMRSGSLKVIETPIINQYGKWTGFVWRHTRLCSGDGSVHRERRQEVHDPFQPADWKVWAPEHLLEDGLFKKQAKVR